MVEQERLEKARRAARLIREGGFGGRIILYGSTARGEEEPSSDIDICIAVDDWSDVDPVAKAINRQAAPNGLKVGHGPGELHIRMMMGSNLTPNCRFVSPLALSITRDGIEL